MDVNVWRDYNAGTYTQTFLTITTTAVYDTSGLYYPKNRIEAPEASAREETPIDWLRRRVDEICWKPE